MLTSAARFTGLSEGRVFEAMVVKTEVCVSAIGERLWRSGRLFPPVVARAKQLNLEAVSSFAGFQRELRLPVRLARFIAVRLGYPGEAFLRTPPDAAPPTQFASAYLGWDAYSRALAVVKEGVGLRGTPALAYGQRFLTPESSVARAALVLRRLGVNSSSSIICLGDDDLTSLALAALAPAYRITVVDIDPAVLSVIDEVARRHGLPISTQSGDLMAEPPQEWLAAFDCAVTDPYPTADHSFERRFASVARRLLRDSQEAFLLVTVGPSHKPATFGDTLLAVLGSSGWRVRDTFEELAEYQIVRGEFTAFESRYLALDDAKSEVISHTKGYAILESLHGFHSDQPTPPFDVREWLQAVSSHDLSQRFGGAERIRAELVERDSPWLQFHSDVPSGGNGIDITPLIADLTGDDAFSVELGQLAHVDRAECVRRLVARREVEIAPDRFAAEASALLAATAPGSLHAYEVETIEAELYLLARIYESYWRARAETRMPA